MCDVDNFYEYLIEKFFVFHPLAELDEANTIDEVAIVKRSVNVNKRRLKDDDMIKLCKCVFKEFKCYHIDETFTNNLTENDAEKVYTLYKRYKCSNSNKTRERETTFELDNTIDTSSTEYVDSLEDVTTDQLKKVFGNYIHSGGSDDYFRYEYRFRFTMDGKVYKFSLYDYLNDDGEFYREQDIYWHVASNTDKKNIVCAFIKKLNQALCQTENDHDDCC